MLINRLKINSKLSGSALLVAILILAGIFIIAFGSGYLAFFNTKTNNLYQDSARARLAAEAGAERMKWELGSNNFDINTQCGNKILETTLADGSYYLKCTLDPTGAPKIRAVGVYKGASFTVNTNICYNLATECTASCLIGSLCGGGVLFSTSSLAVAAPANCQSSDGTGCDNSFLTGDTNDVAWYSGMIPGFDKATDLNDGRINAAILTGVDYPGVYFCDQLNVNGFSNWYLPAKNELNFMLRNSNYCSADNAGPEPLYCARATSTSPIIGGFSIVDSGGDAPINYMSSTEEDTASFWAQDFSNGAQATSTKASTFLFRCIRRAS
jgi:hypothetical protein